MVFSLDLGVCLPKFLLLGPREPVAPTKVRLRATGTYTLLDMRGYVTWGSVLLV